MELCEYLNSQEMMKTYLLKQKGKISPHQLKLIRNSQNVSDIFLSYIKIELYSIDVTIFEQLMESINCYDSTVDHMNSYRRFLTKIHYPMITTRVKTFKRINENLLEPLILINPIGNIIEQCKLRIDIMLSFVLQYHTDLLHMLTTFTTFMINGVLNPDWIDISLYAPGYAYRETKDKLSYCNSILIQKTVPTPDICQSYIFKVIYNYLLKKADDYLVSFLEFNKKFYLQGNQIYGDYLINDNIIYYLREEYKIFQQKQSFQKLFLFIIKIQNTRCEFMTLRYSRLEKVKIEENKCSNSYSRSIYDCDDPCEVKSTGFIFKTKKCVRKSPTIRPIRVQFPPSEYLEQIIPSQELISCVKIIWNEIDELYKIRFEYLYTNVIQAYKLVGSKINFTQDAIIDSFHDINIMLQTNEVLMNKRARKTISNTLDLVEMFLTGMFAISDLYKNLYMYRIANEVNLTCGENCLRLLNVQVPPHYVEPIIECYRGQKNELMLIFLGVSDALLHKFGSFFYYYSDKILEKGVFKQYQPKGLYYDFFVLHKRECTTLQNDITTFITNTSQQTNIKWVGVYITLFEKYDTLIKAYYKFMLEIRCHETAPCTNACRKNGKKCERVQNL